MSMFDRNVKLQFNKMKYQDLVSKERNTYTNYRFDLSSIRRARLILFIFGGITATSLFYFDVFKYKTTRGLARWKNRVVSALFGNHSHSHSHDSHGHGHGDGHKSHDQSNNGSHSGNQIHSDKTHDNDKKESHSHH